MHYKAGIWLKLGIFLASAMVFGGHLSGQTKDSSPLTRIGGDGVSRDFKLSGPLGVFQLPRQSVKVPRGVRALLPRGAKVRLLLKLTFRLEDTLVVYDASDPESANPLMDIRYPGVLVLRENHVIGRASLKRHTSDDPDWVFLEAGEIRLSPDLAGIAVAFRSMGDGSVSLYLVLSPQGEKYQTVLNKITGEGRLRADQEGNVELWDANFGEECEWCDHRYTVFTYKWNGSRLAQLRKTATCRTIDPDPMTDKPIEGVKSLNDEYVEAERKRMQEQRSLKVRLPANLDGVYRGKLGQHQIFMQLGGGKAEQWNRCDFRDPTRKRGRRYPIVASYLDQLDGNDVMLAGVPVSAAKIRLWEYRDNKRTHDVWDLSITHFGAIGVLRRITGHGSKRSSKSTAVSLKRLSRDFDPYFSTEGGYDW